MPHDTITAPLKALDQRGSKDEAREWILRMDDVEAQDGARGRGLEWAAREFREAAGTKEFGADRLRMHSYVLGAPEYNHANFSHHWMRIQKCYRIYKLGSLPSLVLMFARSVTLCRDIHPSPVNLLH
ncbi:hypothetical protein SASPL_101688 [Salvia splendens]|uniref:Uncharacterized protein n=1 Tax=Salvia splendens TaxID=180675 RepID=A0A8X8YV04_SALSN|nr:hypothetical protein SASPL_101688 [Salvia splendens]